MVSLRRADGAVLCRNCRVAETFMSRFAGLMGRARLADDEGLILATSSVHTSFMRFPIDVVFLDAELNVLRIVPSLKPWRATLCRRAKWTVELPANACGARGLDVGDRLAADPAAALA